MMKIICVLLLFFAVLGCGVKGDPLPPERPTEIGRGKPTYKRAFQKIKLPENGNEENENVDEEKDEENAND